MSFTLTVGGCILWICCLNLFDVSACILWISRKVFSCLLPVAGVHWPVLEDACSLIQKLRVVLSYKGIYTSLYAFNSYIFVLTTWSYMCILYPYDSCVFAACTACILYMILWPDLRSAWRSPADASSILPRARCCSPTGKLGTSWHNHSMLNCACHLYKSYSVPVCLCY